MEAGDHWECDAATRAALTSDNVETIEECIRDTGDLEQLLRAAAECGSLTAAGIILERTAGTEKLRESGQGDDTVGATSTALHLAARSPSASSPAMLELLLAHRPHLLETKNQEGRTPLHEAAFGENFVFTMFSFPNYNVFSCKNRKCQVPHIQRSSDDIKG